MDRIQNMTSGSDLQKSIPLVARDHNILFCLVIRITGTTRSRRLRLTNKVGPRLLLTYQSIIAVESQKISLQCHSTRCYVYPLISGNMYVLHVAMLRLD